MTTKPVRLRATQPINVSTGALLDTEDPYDAPVGKDGALHFEDQAHVDNGRLVPIDDREVKDGQVVEPSKPAVRGKQEA